ncbi:hypothetical protein AXG89_05445 [Burkholderia sp. PAMC 26561]|nr:hypothetical protein AXG89_05445 [Burkholderia sp. PAMC 26561]
MRKSGGRFSRRRYAWVSKNVGEIAEPRSTRNFESAMLTRKKLSIEGIGSDPFAAKNKRVRCRSGLKTGPCHNTGVTNTNRMPA